MLRVAAQAVAKRAAPQWGAAAARPALVPFARCYADDANLLKTALYDFHLEMGAKMVRVFESTETDRPIVRWFTPRTVVITARNHSPYLFHRPPPPSYPPPKKQVPFAGHSMPIQYGDSIMDATKHCRTEASIFDVSHMLGSSIRGKDAIKFTERIVVGDIAGLKNGTGTLSVVTNEHGGIIDDTVVTKINDQDVYIVLVSISHLPNPNTVCPYETDNFFYLSQNGGCSEKDQAHINKHLAEFKKNGGDAEFIVHADRSLLAFQGPKAVDVLQPLTKLDLKTFYFGMFTETKIDGKDVWITRTGYTGEDGFEISLKKQDTVSLTKKLLENPASRLCGLGARDSLRLEAGLCLYGNDLNEQIGPLEAGLTWTIGKSRRDDCSFVGGDVIKKQLADGVAKRRVGFKFTGKGAPARGGSVVKLADGTVVGEITSGGFSPVLGENIAMGYVQKAFAKAGTELMVETRGKSTPAVTAKMPFVTCHYHRPSA
jgi:aminomethyltransferase